VKELAPLDDDWLYTRVASLARKIYVRPRTGVKLLTHIYGGNHQVGSRRSHHESSSGKVIRWGLQQLEKLKVIKKGRKTHELKVNSRVISKEGVKDLNRIATEIALAQKVKATA
jgi:small subunit ribosomal protein S19e